MSCANGCRSIVTPEQTADIECTECGGIGCAMCEQGYFILSQCPMRFVGNMIDDINLVAQCDGGVLPVAGGLLDQPAYFAELQRRLKHEESIIEREQERRRA